MNNNKTEQENTLSDKELKNAIKNHPDMIHFRKVVKVECIIIGSIFAVGLIALPPVSFGAAIVFLVLLPFLLIGSAISKHAVKKKILEKGVDGAYTDSRQARKIKIAKARSERPVQSTNTSANSERVQEVLDNPVVEVAASYALGKAAVNSVSNSRSAQKLTRRLDEQKQKPQPRDSVYKYTTNGKSCANCRYYNCQRKLEGRMVLISRSALDRNGNAPCGKIRETTHNPAGGMNCRSWEKGF